MKFDVGEIVNILKQEISQYGKKVDLGQVGKVVEVGDGIARLYGLENVMAGEMLQLSVLSSWRPSTRIIKQTSIASTAI